MRRKRRGVKEEEEGGLSIELSLWVVLQVVKCFRKDLLTWEYHEVPGRVEIVLTGQLRTVSTRKYTYRHICLSSTDSLGTTLSGLILCERQNLRT